MLGDLYLIQSIGIMIVAAAAAILLLRRLNTPTIVVYILVGLALTPLLGNLSTSRGGPAASPPEADAVEIIAEVGIALLLFLVGLELSLEKIRDVGKVAFYAGIGQVIFTAAGGFAIALLLNFNAMESIFLATALTFSSTVVVVKLLDQKREIHTLYGRIAVGIFLVQDLVVIVILTFLAGLGSPESASLGEMTWSVVRAFAGMGALLAFALLASRYLLPRPFEWAARSPQALFIWSLCWCFLFVVAAEWMGLSPEIGAFLAGMSLAQLGGSNDLRRRVHPLMNFFIAIFFVSLGVQMELQAAAAQWKAAVAFSLFVLIGNPLIFMWIIAKHGYSERVSFLTSVTVAQISEFSFIFAAVGLNAGLIDRSILSLIAVVGLVTIAVSAYMILYNHWLYERLRGGWLLGLFPQGSLDETGEDTPQLRGHIIVAGMNALGRRLAEALHARGETVLAIDTDGLKLEGLPCRTMAGNIDYLAALEDAGLAQAKLAVSALQIEDTNNLLAYRCKQLGVPVVIHAFDRSVTEALQRLRVDYLIDSKVRGVARLAHELKQAGVAAT